MTKIDQIFIINVYWCADLFKREIRSDARNIVVVSSHCLFENEKLHIREKSKSVTVYFRQFDSWNSNIEDQNLDEKAYLKFVKWARYTSIYQRMLLQEITYLKNAFVFDGLKKDFEISDETIIIVNCDTDDLVNLGVSWSFWNEIGAVIIRTTAIPRQYLVLKQFTSYFWIRISIYFVRALLLSFKPTYVLKVKDGDIFYLLSQKRISLKNGLAERKQLIVPFFIRFKKGYLACPIHSSSNMHSMYPLVRKSKMVIVQDAFRPTTYPPFYYANSFTGCKLIPSSRIDQSFFSGAGIESFELGTLLKMNKLPVSHGEIQRNIVKTICLSLNHSGNWTSLISRADTDSLIVEFVKLAKDLPTLNFLIRLHPNSSSMKAEGLTWVSRIDKQIAKLQVKNLEISSVKLAEDWARSDLFITEYSLSVINALRYGKPVLFVNLTKRKSFVKDLTDVGFIEVNSYVTLLTEIRKAVNDSEELYLSLLKAASKFNSIYLN